MDNPAAARGHAGERREPVRLGLRPGVAVLFVFFIANIAHSCAIFDFIGHDAVRVAMAVEYAIILFCIFIAYGRQHSRILLYTVLIIAGLILANVNFSLVSGLPTNINAALSIGVLSALIIFYESSLPLRSILHVLLICSLGYTLAYDVLGRYLIDFASMENRILLASDGIRIDRLFLGAQFSIFVLFYGILNIRRSFALSIGCILIGGLAIYLAQSRMSSLVVVLSTIGLIAGTAVPSFRRPIAFGYAAIVVGTGILLLYGYLDPSWNPYSFFADDSSGTARFFQYRDAVDVMAGHHWLGVGIPSSVEAAQDFVRPERPFYDVDLGIAGVAFNIGLPGALVFLGVLAKAVVSLPPAAREDDPIFMAFAATTQQACLYSTFATPMWGGPATIFLAITFAIWMKGGYAAGRFRVPGSMAQDHRPAQNPIRSST